MKYLILTIHSPIDVDVLPGKEDYRPYNQTIVIPVGAQEGNSYCINMSYFIIDDEILESAETFSIELIDVSPCGTVGSADSTTVEIIDNDSKDFTLPVSDL